MQQSGFITTLVTEVCNSKFTKNVFALLSGNIIAQIIAISSSPITARLFTPENFGTFALFMAICGIMSNVSCLCYERAIVLPKYEIEALNVLVLSIVTLVGFCLISAGVISVFAHRFAVILGVPKFYAWFYIIPLVVFILGLLNILRVWRLRETNFDTIALSRIFESGVSVLVKILFGFLIGAYTGGLILGAFTGFIAALIILISKPAVIRIRSLRKIASLRRAKVVSRKYKKFPLFASWNALLNFFSQNLIIFVLSSFFTPSIVGFYSLGNRVLKQPIGFLSQSVQNAYFQKAASITANGYRLLPSLRKITLVLLLIGIVPFGLIALLGKYLFGIVFGSRWHMAGIFVQVMAPWFLLLFVGAPSNVVYEVLQKQDWKLILNSLKALLRGLVLIGGALISRDPFMVLILFIVVNVIFELLTILLAFTFSSRKISPV